MSCELAMHTLPPGIYGACCLERVTDLISNSEYPAQRDRAVYRLHMTSPVDPEWAQVYTFEEDNEHQTTREQRVKRVWSTAG